MIRFIRNLLVSVCFLGYFPFASGTLTSIFAAILYALFIPPLGTLGFILFTLILLVASVIFVPIIKRAEIDLGHDSKKITIDEFIGYGFAVMFLPHSLMIMIYALVLFRIFDIIKPTPIKQLQKLPHGWGVLADDILAGVCANILIQVLLIFFPHFF